MVPPSSDRISRVPPYFSRAQFHTSVFAYGAITRYDRTFQTVPLTPMLKLERLLPFRSPLLWESRLISVPLVTEMFQFSRFAPRLLCIQRRVTLCRAGFPHSEICGSAPICRLPAAYRRLSRPSSPVIAKASTTCTYSLDPITLPPHLAWSSCEPKSLATRSQ